jgi:hypothetical protein
MFVSLVVPHAVSVSEIKSTLVDTQRNLFRGTVNFREVCGQDMFVFQDLSISEEYCKLPGLPSSRMFRDKICGST